MGLSLVLSPPVRGWGAGTGVPPSGCWWFWMLGVVRAASCGCRWMHQHRAAPKILPPPREMTHHAHRQGKVQGGAPGWAEPPYLLRLLPTHGQRKLQLQLLLARRLGPRLLQVGSKPWG